MTTDLDQPSLRSRLELGRFLTGSLLETALKAYGAGAAASVAMSDAETTGGKVRDAIAAVPTLSQKYREAKYVVDHRAEIQAAVDYMNTHTPPRAELEDSAAKTVDTLRHVETTYGEIGRAWDSLSLNPLAWEPRAALGHVRAAWEAKPDLDSIRHLAGMAEQVGPYADHAQTLIPVYYGLIAAVTDNFARDEIVATVVVMAVALGIAVVLGRTVGFWVRRGRPGLVAMLLQRWGARVFHGWYVRHLPRALGPSLYAAARERIERDILADPEAPLDAGARRELDAYFRSRGR